MTQVIFWFVVAVGFNLGARYGGNIGSFIGGTLAFAACLLGTDLFYAKRSVDGFMLRHRGSFLDFVAVVVGIIVGRHFYDEFLGTMGGTVAGVLAGQWLNNRLGWGGDSYNQEIGFRILYLGILHSIAATGRTPNDRETRELEACAKRIFLELGLATDADIKNLIGHAQQPLAGYDIPSFVAGMSRDWQLRLALDAMRVVYSNFIIDDQKRNWIYSIYEWSGINDMSLLALYDRSVSNTDNMKAQWLDELGLSLAATSTDIDAAYRHLVKQYHPDKLQNVPSQVLTLAHTKMAALNAAYHGLKNQNCDIADLRFRGANEGEVITADGVHAIVCCCWLCNRSNRLPPEATVESARCGECHALLGAAAT